jgi:hypothetical protein
LAAAAVAGEELATINGTSGNDTLNGTSGCALLSCVNFNHFLRLSLLALASLLSLAACSGRQPVLAGAMADAPAGGAIND